MKEKQTITSYYCAPAIWIPSQMNTARISGWVLIKEVSTRIPGTNWTTREPMYEPQVTAYRYRDSHIWYKGKPRNIQMKLDNTRIEVATDEEAIGIILMAKPE